jgi:uncharacterized protein YbbC (DUF1343 family)
VRVQLGSERLLAGGALRGRRVGVVCNPSSVDHQFVHSADRIEADHSTGLAAIFGPQHGFRSDLQENMIETAHAHDELRRVPVYSLYSETREPTAAMLDGLDVLVIDLQDVGTRIYTYIYTMANCLAACRKHAVKAIVCDRPNPIGGLAVEGPMLVHGFESFVGQFPIPMRHGMTIGELARLFNDHFGIGADLEVVPIEGWRREAYHDETDVPWVMPSPNIPTLDSEARGTTHPFELVGAPHVVAERFADALNRRRLPGVHFRPALFEPTFHKHARRGCGGCQIHVVDRSAFRPVLTGVALVAAFRQADPEFAWRQPPYEYEHEKMPFDILAGSSELREQIEAGVAPEKIAGSWEPAVAEFARLRANFLMY